MILKIATGERQWTLYDNLIWVTHRLVPYSEVKDWDAFGFVGGDIPKDENRIVLWISSMDSRGEEKGFVVTSMAFLMNDDGKTIERIY